MLIDWFTVAAQALNFVILVWLLKRFLYKPVLDAIDAREKRIASELADADAKKVAASKESDEFQRKNKEFDQQRAALLSQATDEVEVERQRLLDQARQAAAALHAKLQEALRSEQQNLSDEIGRRTREEVFAIARKALTDLSGMTLEQRIGEVFMQRLQTLGEDEKADFAKSIKSSSNPVLLRSAFELLPVQKTAIQQAINKTFPDDIQLRFETVPDMIGGMALIANGKKIAWNIDDYLDVLGESVNDFLKDRVADQSKSAVDAADVKTEAKDDKQAQKPSAAAIAEK